MAGKQNGKKKAKQNGKKEAKQNGEKEAKQKEKKEVKQNGEKEAKQNGEKEAKQNGEKEAKQNGEKEAKQNGEKEAKQNGDKEAKQNGKKEAKQNGEKEAKQNGEKEAKQNGEKEAKQNGEKEAKQNEEKEAIQKEEKEIKRQIFEIKARLRRDRYMTDNERIGDYRRRRQLNDTFLTCTTKARTNILRRRKDLERLVHFFMNNMLYEDKSTEERLRAFFYDVGVIDGAVHEMRTFFFRQMDRITPVLVEESVDKRENIEKEVNCVKDRFDSLTESSHNFSTVLKIHLLKTTMIKRFQDL